MIIKIHETGADLTQKLAGGKIDAIWHDMVEDHPACFGRCRLCVDLLACGHAK